MTWMNDPAYMDSLLAECEAEARVQRAVMHVIRLLTTPDITYATVGKAMRALTDVSQALTERDQAYADTHAARLNAIQSINKIKEPT